MKKSKVYQDIRTLCLEFQKVHKLLISKKAKKSKKQNIYMLTYNSRKAEPDADTPSQGAEFSTRIHHPDIVISNKHEDFLIRKAFKDLEDTFEAFVQTLSKTTNTPRDNITFSFTFYKKYSDAAMFFLDAPGKRIFRIKAGQAGRYEQLEKAFMNHLDIICHQENTI